MRESFWGIFIIGTGVTILAAIYVFQSITNTDQHNYNLLKETTEAAMYDAFDYGTYINTNGTVIKINREKFVESFIRRFAENANLAREYTIQIYDVNEEPPKVSIRVTARGQTASDQFSASDGEIYEFQLSNQLDAILEVPS